MERNIAKSKIDQGKRLKVLKSVTIMLIINLGGGSGSILIVLQSVQVVLILPRVWYIAELKEMLRKWTISYKNSHTLYIFKAKMVSSWYMKEECKYFLKLFQLEAENRPQSLLQLSDIYKRPFCYQSSSSEDSIEGFTRRVYWISLLNRTYQSCHPWKIRWELASFKVANYKKLFSILVFYYYYFYSIRKNYFRVWSMG